MNAKESLLSDQRLDNILKLLEENNHLSVSTICKELKISPATARRDLDSLSKKGLLKRVHGGAKALNIGPAESPIFQRMNKFRKNKIAIGEAAASLIKNGETVFLGSGTTVFEVAKNLKQHEEITVITNSLLVINELIPCTNITIVALGGIVRQSEFSMIGSITEKALDGLNAGKIIIGIHGIDTVQGLTNHYLPETMTDRRILQLGKELIIVADHTKCGVISTSKVASINSVTTLVTDNEAPEEFVDELKSLNINVIQA